MAVNEIFKNGSIKANVAATTSMTKTSIKFTTQDNGTAKLIFNITKDNGPLPLSSAATAKIFLRMADGSVFEKDATIIDPVKGQVEYILVEEINHPGTVKGEMNVYFSNGQSMTVCQFQFAIEKTVKDRDIVPVAEYFVKDFRTLQTDIEQRAAVINETVDEMQAKVDEFESTAVTLDPRLTTVEEKVATATTQLAEKATKAELTTSIAPKADKTYVDNEIGKKTDKSYVDTQILSLGKVELKGVYATLSELQSAFPTGSTGIFVVTADGFSYYWNGTAWTKGTQFQGTAISPKSVTSDKLAFDPIIGKKGKNLFNKATAFLNQNINTTTGALSASAGVFTSDFIEVKSSTTYSLTKVTADSFMIVYFDGAKQIISSASNPASITTPANAMFVRFRTTMAGLDIAQFEEGAVKSGYEPYGITPQFVSENSIDPKVLKNGITPEKTTFFENGKNLFNKDAVTSGYFVSSSTGNLSANASYVASEFIPIVPNETYARSYINQIAFYDSNKVYISGIPTAEATTSFTAPANAYFVRVTVWAEYVATYQLERGTNLTAYESFGSKVAKNFLPANIVSSGIKLITPADILREFINRGQPFKVKYMGDSITQGAGGTGRADDGDLIPGTTFRMNPNGYCWANSLRDLLQAKYNARVVNYAQSGTNSSIMYDQRNTLIEDDDDLLIMQLGTNDRQNLATTTVLKEKQRGIIEAAYAKGVKVILMSACPATVEGDNEAIRNFGMYDVDKAIRELANEYNMEHISNYDAFLQYAEFRNINMDTLLADGLHPNDAGYDVMFHNIVRNLGISYRRPGITK